MRSPIRVVGIGIEMTLNDYVAERALCRSCGVRRRYVRPVTAARQIFPSTHVIAVGWRS